MMRHIQTAMFIGLVVLLGSPKPARSNELAFAANVDKTQVLDHDKIVLRLTIDASEPSMISELSLPETGTLSIISTQKETNAVNSSQGVQNRQVIQMVLVPTAPGKTTIERASLIYKDKKYFTDPIDIEVISEQPSATRAGPPSSHPSWQPDPNLSEPSRSPQSDQFPLYSSQKLRDGIFITVHLSPDSLVEGQQLTATLAVFANLRARIREIRWPRLKGFFSVARDVSSINTENRIIDNVPYQYKVLDRKALFPLEAGILQLDAIEVDVELFSLPSLYTQARTLKTKPMQIHVKKLPLEGQPRNFHQANVGKYQISASVDATDVTLNGQITYKLKIEGAGNLQLVRPPELPQLARFKVFDPTTKVSTNKHSFYVKGSKTLIYNLVPISSGELVIPSLTFSYFDLEKLAYRNIEPEPQVIRVKAVSPNGIDNRMVDGHQVNIVATGFETAIPYDSKLEGFSTPFYRHTLFWPALIFPPVLALMFIAAGLINTYIHADSQRNRKKKAWARKQKRLKRASRLVSAKQARNFYAELKAAILDGIEAHTGLMPQGLTIEELQTAMRQMGVHTASIDAMMREVENCDFGRFAPAESHEEEMRTALKRVKNMMRLLEQ